MPTVIVYWSPTRTTEEKEAVAQGIIDTLVKKGNASPKDILVIFQNIEDGNAFRAANIKDTHQSSNQDNT